MDTAIVNAVCCCITVAVFLGACGMARLTRKRVIHFRPE